MEKTAYNSTLEHEKRQKITEYRNVATATDLRNITSLLRKI